MPPESAAVKNKVPTKGHVASKDTPKKPRGRPPKKVKKESDDDEGETYQTQIKKKAGRPAKKLPPKGGWIYTVDRGSAAEGEVADKGFPWVSTITLQKQISGDATEFLEYEHRTAILAKMGTVALTEDNPERFKDTSQGALGGILDKQNEVFIIDENTAYRASSITKRCRYVEGHEVLDEKTRDRFIVAGEIEWDEDVKFDAVGKVTKEVFEQGNVTDAVLANHRTEEDEKAGLAAKAEEKGEEEMQELATPSRFKHGGDGEEHNGLIDEEEDQYVREEGAGGDSGVPKEEDMGEEPKVKTPPPPKKNGKGNGGRM